MHGRWADLRTAVAGVDPGLERLRLAGIGSASMVLAVVVMAAVRALTGQPVSLLIFAAVLAMISNLAVNEPDLSRRRATTALIILPAAVAVTAGTLLAPHRLVADVVLVAVTMAAVYVRRFGPRGFALGMAGFMPYFFTQFLQARPAELPWLLVAAVTGLGATLLLRGYVFAERDDRTLARLLRAFHAHVHGLVVATAALLAAAGGPADRVESALQDTRRRRTRLNRTALLVADRLDRLALMNPAARNPATRSPAPRTRTGPGNGSWMSSVVRISQALMAFWVTAVLALMYGLIGQFSLETLELRIEETAVGAVMGMLAAFLVLPRRTHDAYDEAHDDLVSTTDAVLVAATDQFLGRVPSGGPNELARDMDDALSTLRDRTAPLTGPWRRASDGYRDALHVLHRTRDQPAPVSAEELIDAAEAWAARCVERGRRHDLLEAARLLRRIDQSLLVLAGVPPTLSRR
ncbi:FUSC family protein [Pseudonocardia charpentierae]|uniref:Fusaric acid resistance protein-like n=1 Tax=Pseudonocardia charpentierae TaxID=3075545 RepID=A0ABU2NAL4_9PSEU|nr:hypothetical protein [Pseudonocardia sp. DSM 45834]MDT0350988.1 hypothetical protein [Pseudonocardia sp. DSM 45834]